MSGSAVVTLEQRVPLVVLKLKPRPLPLGQGGRLAAHEEEGGQERRARDGRAGVVCEASPRGLDKNTWRLEGHQERRS